MKDTACIAIDLGATSGRVILAKMKHGRLETEILNRFPNVIKEIDGRCYWDIYSLFDSIKEGLNMAASRRIAIDSIGVDTWGVDFVCVRPDGSFVSLPRAYRDPYTEGVPEQYFRHIPREEVYRLTGIQFMNFNSLFQLYAMRLEGSIDIDGVRSILFMPDAISYLLTGKEVCEYTILSTSQLMNPETCRIEERLLEPLHIPVEKFPPVVMPGRIIGNLRDDVAAEIGLSAIPVVAVAGHDTASAVAAVPASGRNFAYDESRNLPDRRTVVGTFAYSGRKISSGRYAGPDNRELTGRCSGRNRIVGYSCCSCCRSRYGIGGGGRAGIGKEFRLSQFRYLVVDGYRIGKADCHRRGLSNEFHERGRYRRDYPFLEKYHRIVAFGTVPESVEKQIGCDLFLSANRGNGTVRCHERELCRSR